jgi:hypothetical protein
MPGMALDVPLTHVHVPQADGSERLQRLDALSIADARLVIVRLVERVEAAEDEAAAMRLAASHAQRSSKRAKYATNRTR